MKVCDMRAHIAVAMLWLAGQLYKVPARRRPGGRRLTRWLTRTAFDLITRGLI